MLVDVFLLAPVPAPLQAVVRRLAAYDEPGGHLVRRRQAPTSTCTLIIELGDPLRVDGRVVGSFLGGLTDVAVITEFSGHQAGVQVDLAPLGVLRLLGTPPGTLGPLRPLRDLAAERGAGSSLARLPERLAALPTWPERLTAVTGALTELLTRTTVAPDPEVAHAWRLLATAGGRVPVAALAGEVGWSRRHLTRRFTEQVGLSPTTTGRVLRFRRAADLLVPGPGRPAGPPLRIGDVAATCGFADHAHLDREFRALAGCTPAHYVAGWADVGVDPADVVHG